MIMRKSHFCTILSLFSEMSLFSQKLTFVYFILKRTITTDAKNWSLWHILCGRLFSAALDMFPTFLGGEGGGGGGINFCAT